MAGLFALLYGIARGGAEIGDSIRNEKLERMNYESAYLNNSMMYSVGGQLYWTATKKPCYIYTHGDTKQIRSGTGLNYGSGMILYDYNAEQLKEKERCEKEQYAQAEKDYWTKNTRYGRYGDYNYDFVEKRPYYLGDDEKQNVFYICYLTNYKGTWCIDDIYMDLKQLTYEEWEAAGGRLGKKRASYPYLSEMIKCDEKEQREEIERKQREKNLKRQKELEEEQKNEVLMKTIGIDIILFLLLFFLVAIF